MSSQISYIVLIKNIFFNLIRGSLNAIIAVILPPFLVRILPNETYSVWVIILQLSAYVSFFEFGVQTAVGRFVAYTDELGDSRKRDRIINTSLAILSASGFLALLFIFFLVWRLGYIFPKIPRELLFDTKLALLLVGSSVAICLPFSVFNGIFVGTQRYEIPAIIIGLGKLATGILIFSTAKMSGSIVIMSATVSGANIISSALIFIICKQLYPDIKYHYNLISQKASKEVFSYCFGLSIWSFSMLLINGLDTTIIAIFDFKTVASFSIAASLVTLIVGLQSAIFNVLIPVGAVMDARENASGLGRLLIASTRYNMLILLITGIPLILGAKYFLTFWVGKDYAEEGAVIFRLLIIANIIRISATPYAILLIATAQQNLVIITPLIESFTNLVISLFLGSRIGATGVVLGTLIAGIVGILGHLIYNIPRTKGIKISRLGYIKDGLLRPSVCFVSLMFIQPISNLLGSPIADVILVIYLILLTFVNIWYFALLRTERHQVILRLSQAKKYFAKKK